jgi:3'-5' exoribonuclease
MNDKMPVSDKKIIEYDIGDNITSFYVVRKKYLREYTKGTFITFELGDASGRISAVLWSPDQFSLEELEEGMIVKIQGQVGEYNNKRQLNINRMNMKSKIYWLIRYKPKKNESHES